MDTVVFHFYSLKVHVYYEYKNHEDVSICQRVLFMFTKSLKNFGILMSNQDEKNEKGGGMLLKPENFSISIILIKIHSCCQEIDDDNKYFSENSH